MEMVCGNSHQSSSLPQVVGENSETGPDRASLRPFRQDPSQPELTFKHTNRRFDAAAKTLELPKPLRLLMSFFFRTQPTHFRNADSLDTRFAKRQYVVGAVVAPVGGQGLRLYTEIVLCLAHQRKQFGTITGITLMNLVVKDDPGTILNELQGTPKFHRFVELPLADRPRLRVVKRNNPIGYRLLALKLLLGLLEKGLCQLDLLTQALCKLGRLRLIGRRTAQGLKYLAALLETVGGELGYFFKNSFSFLFALFGVGFGHLAPVKQRPLSAPYMAAYPLTQRRRRAGKGFNRLMENSNIVWITDVSLNSCRVDPYPPWLNRACLYQLLDQTLVKPSDPIFAESLVELDQRGRVGNFIHQRKVAEIPPRQSFPDFFLNFVVAQSPAKFQVHHPKIDSHGCPRTSQSRIEGFFKRFQQLRVGQKLVNLGQFFVQFIQRSIDEAIAKTHLLRYGSAHYCFCTPYGCSDPRKL